MYVSHRESAASGEEQVQLGALAAAVVAVREGLQPVSLEQYTAAAADLAGTANQQPLLKNGAGQSTISSSHSISEDSVQEELPEKESSGSGGVGTSSIASRASLERVALASPGESHPPDTISSGRVEPQQQQEALRQLLGPSSEGLTDAQATEIAARRAALALSPEGTELAARQVAWQYSLPSAFETMCCEFGQTHHDITREIMNVLV